MQLAKYGIRVNAICPGIVITPLNLQWLADTLETTVVVEYGPETFGLGTRGLEVDGEF